MYWTTPKLFFGCRPVSTVLQFLAFAKLMGNDRETTVRTFDFVLGSSSGIPYSALKQSGMMLFVQSVKFLYTGFGLGDNFGAQLFPFH